MEQKHLSELLLEELVKRGILKINHDKEAAKKIVRNYFIKIHRAAIEDTRCAMHKKEYVEPQFLDI